jgi:recombination protein RecA
MNMSAMAFGDKYVVPGGKAMAYHCSVRIRLASVGKIKKGDEIIGINCKAQVVKNRMGPPWKTAEFEIFFDSGIQDLKSWLNFLKTKGKAKASGPKYKIKIGEEEHNLSVAEFVDKVNKDAAFKEEVYNYICDTVIMHYRDPNSAIDEDVQIDDESDGTDTEASEE